MICDNCGDHFKVDEARLYFNTEMQLAFGPGFDYDTMFPIHHLCGGCAMAEAAMDEELNDEERPEGCEACGSDLYPICKEGCPLMDD